jgi:hypothetical protein
MRRNSRGFFRSVKLASARQTIGGSITSSRGQCDMAEAPFLRHQPIGVTTDANRGANSLTLLALDPYG